YLSFDCGPHGTDNCGHAHADALAIELAAHGQPLLVDPGTLTYTGSPELRNAFRRSSAHNALLVDGEPSSLPAGPFSWKTIANCKTLSWLSERRFDYVEGTHDGYERLAEPTTHTRSILFLKNDYWLMRDRVSSTGSHKLALRFHFAPESKLQVVAASSETAAGAEAPDKVAQLLELSGEKVGLQIAAFCPERALEGRWSREESFVSQCYGSSEAAPVWTFSADLLGNSGTGQELITLLLPNSGQISTRFQVREVEAIGGRAFEIISADHCDLILLRDSHGKRVETVRLVSDFNLSWARFRNDRSEVPEELLELVVLDGQSVGLDGKEILRSAKLVQYLVASRVGERFRVETSAGLMDLSLPIGEMEVRKPASMV